MTVPARPVSRIEQFLRNALSDSHMGVLRALRRTLVELPHVVPVAAARTLPASTRLRMRAAMQVVQRLDYPAREIWLHVDSPIEQRVRLISCAREPETVRWIEETFRPGEVFYDVGANVGPYSLVASKFFDGAVRVYAFEPAFVNFVQLCRNVLRNRCHESIVPLAVALSDQTRIDTFHYQNLDSGGALHAVGRPVGYRGFPFTPVWTQPVLAYRLDDLVHEFALPLPQHIKIDVDGMEIAVLRGGEQTLQSGIVRSVLVEVSPDTASGREVVQYLTEHGFRGSSDTRHPGGIANCVFQREA